LPLEKTALLLLTEQEKEEVPPAPPLTALQQEEQRRKRVKEETDRERDNKEVSTALFVISRYLFTLLAYAVLQLDTLWELLEQLMFCRGDEKEQAFEKGKCQALRSVFLSPVLM